MEKGSSSFKSDKGHMIGLDSVLFDLDFVFCFLLFLFKITLYACVFTKSSTCLLSKAFSWSLNHGVELTDDSS